MGTTSSAETRHMRYSWHGGCLLVGELKNTLRSPGAYPGGTATFERRPRRVGATQGAHSHAADRNSKINSQLVRSSRARPFSGRQGTLRAGERRGIHQGTWATWAHMSQSGLQCIGTWAMHEAHNAARGKHQHGLN